MKYQFMPMFWGDFFANTLHLTAQEVGAYVLLIGHAWEHDGNIAVADLQRVARVDNRNWKKIKPRVAQFFEHLGGCNFWTSQRVRSELAHAAEISNKRKDAALQKHSKSTCKSSANTPPSILQLPIEKLSNGKGSEAPQAKPPPPRQGPSPDPGLDYRSPPRNKSDNPLIPILDRPLVKRP